jgi:hypothetical protein
MNASRTDIPITDNEALPRDHTLQGLANPKDAKPADADTSMCANSSPKMHVDHGVGQDKKCAPDAIFKGNAKQEGSGKQEVIASAGISQSPRCSRSQGNALVGAAPSIAESPSIETAIVHSNDKTRKESNIQETEQQETVERNVPKDVPDGDHLPDDQPDDEPNGMQSDEQNEANAPNGVPANFPNDVYEGVLHDDTNERNRRHQEFVAIRRRSTERHQLTFATALLAGMDDEDSLPGDAAAG